MNQLTPRLQLAGMAMQGMLSNDGQLSYTEAADMALKHADDLLAADAKSPVYVTDMARTIQRLETVLRHLVEAVKEPALVSMGPDQPMEYFNDYDHWLAKAIYDAKSVLSQYTEAAK